YTRLFGYSIINKSIITNLAIIKHNERIFQSIPQPLSKTDKIARMLSKEFSENYLEIYNLYIYNEL
ncbi:hypothetical protein, partial [Oceanobacillus massiliensis]|uniref:hypothetical protein n=1 Tax=Oceanobacillus massiliensis TaxID=1465765 RepID=UPI003018F234